MYAMPLSVLRVYWYGFSRRGRFLPVGSGTGLYGRASNAPRTSPFRTRAEIFSAIRIFDVRRLPDVGKRSQRESNPRKPYLQQAALPSELYDHKNQRDSAG